MPHKDQQQRRAYARARYWEQKQEKATHIAKNPRAATSLLRKSPGKALRKVKDAEAYADSVITWLEKKGAF